MTTKTSNAKSASAAPARKSTRSSAAGVSAAAEDAIKLLKADHDEVDGLFKKYNKLASAEAADDERGPLAEQICLMLTVHATIEEEIFYPAARDAEVDSDLLDEAEVEHASLKELIAQIRAMSPGDDLYDAKVTVLGEYVTHHVDEEEGEMFPKCRSSEMDLKALGAEMAERKQALMAKMGEGMEAAG